MFSKIRLFSVTVLVLAFGAFAGAVLAQDSTTTPKDNVQKPDKFERRGGFGRRGGDGFRGGMHRGGPLGMLRGINLTDEQKQQIHAILERNKPDQSTIDQMEKFRQARQSGTGLTAEQKEQLKSFREAQRSKMESIHQQILNVLTPEQKLQLEQRKQEMRQRMEQRKQFRRQDKPSTDKSVTTTKPIDG